MVRISTDCDFFGLIGLKCLFFTSPQYPTQVSFWTDWIRKKIKQSTGDADADTNASDDADVDDDAEEETGEDYHNPKLPRWREKVNFFIFFIFQS